MRLDIHRPLIIAVLPLLALALTGCESDGPEFSTGETTTFIEGVLDLEETSDTHFRALSRGGTVNIEATDFTATLGPTGAVIEDYILGVSVGIPGADDETRCQITFSKTLDAGESFSVYAQDGIFCVATFRPPELEQETRVNYLLTLSGAFS